MANSGIVWIDLVFDFGVMVLLVVGDFLGITYEEINVYLFCIVWPLSLVFLVLQSFWIIKLSKINNRSIPGDVSAVIKSYILVRLTSISS